MELDYKSVVYQGTKGAWSDVASRGFFGEKINANGMRNFHELFSAIESGAADYGMVPVENTVAGSVAENYDYLYKHDLRVIGEISVKIKWALLGLLAVDKTPEQRLLEIIKAFSHYKALEQCQDFFVAHSHISPVEHYDTAGAAEYVALQNDPTIGAIASAAAGGLYNLSVILDDIGDHKECYTRFLAVTKNNEVVSVEDGKYKYLVAFVLPDAKEAGSLHDALQIFADFGISLSKIESRPIIGKPFEYVFYADFSFDAPNHSRVLEGLAKFHDYAKDVKVLGPYKVGKTIQ